MPTRFSEVCVLYTLLGGGGEEQQHRLAMAGQTLAACPTEVSSSFKGGRDPTTYCF